MLKMQTEEGELVRQTEENNVASTSVSENTQMVRENVSCCNLQELSAQSTSCTLPTSSCGECSHEHYQKKFNVHDKPPPYAEAIYGHKNHLHPLDIPLHIHSTTQTREEHEEETIANYKKIQYKRRVKGFKRLVGFAACLYCFAAIYLLYLHRKMTLKNLSNQEEALNNVIVVTNANISWPYEGQLVHVVGPLSISEPLTDPECGFAMSSVKMKRFVHNSEIYMMVKTKLGCTDPLETEPRYYYTRKGGDTLINANLMCVNPKNMFLKRWDIKEQVQTAREVKIGSLRFGRELKELFNEYVYVTDKVMELQNDNAVRLMFSYAGKNGDTYSVLGKVNGGVIVPYRTEVGDVILSKRRYIFTAEEMIRLYHFHSSFTFYQRSYAVSAGAISLFIALYYYYMVHPLRPREGH